MQAQLSTLCYLERDNEYLMLHRVVKKNDVNKDKWIGVGGHFEQDESPEECVLREVREETGYTMGPQGKDRGPQYMGGGQNILSPFGRGGTFLLPEACLRRQRRACERGPERRSNADLKDCRGKKLTSYGMTWQKHFIVLKE